LSPSLWDGPLAAPEYNILKVAGNSLGYKHSEKVLAKISQALTSVNNPMYGKIGEDNPMFGRISSLDTIVKMSEAKKGLIVLLRLKLKLVKLY